MNSPPPPPPPLVRVRRVARVMHVYGRRARSRGAGSHRGRGGFGTAAFSGPGGGGGGLGRVPRGMLHNEEAGCALPSVAGSGSLIGAGSAEDGGRAAMDGGADTAQIPFMPVPGRSVPSRSCPCCCCCVPEAMFAGGSNLVLCRRAGRHDLGYVSLKGVVPANPHAHQQHVLPTCAQNTT